MILNLTAQEKSLFKLVADEASRINQEVYVVGGFVRDRLLERFSKDIDFVTVGDGPALATNVVSALGKEARDLSIPQTQEKCVIIILFYPSVKNQ